MHHASTKDILHISHLLATYACSLTTAIKYIKYVISQLFESKGICVRKKKANKHMLGEAIILDGQFPFLSVFS